MTEGPCTVTLISEFRDVLLLTYLTIIIGRILILSGPLEQFYIRIKKQTPFQTLRREHCLRVDYNLDDQT